MNFRERVLEVVSSIPAGAVLSYQAVAKRAGSPRAARVVGQIMNHNQRSFLTTKPAAAIPCHRVVGSDQRLGGFNAGAKAKLRLLNLEGWQLEHDRLVKRS